MSNGPKTNKTKKQNKKPAKKTARAAQSRGVQVAFGTSDGGGERFGDSLQVYDLPGADRESLARHLTMVAGSVLATKGDPLDGATIIVVTRRKS